MRISLAFGAWLDHEPVWLPPEKADAVLTAFRDELPWEQREIVLFARSAHSGHREQPDRSMVNAPIGDRDRSGATRGVGG